MSQPSRVQDQHWTIFVRANRHQPWRRLYYEKLTYRQCWARTKHIVPELDWMVCCVKTVVTRVASYIRPSRSTRRKTR